MLCAERVAAGGSEEVGKNNNTLFMFAAESQEGEIEKETEGRMEKGKKMKEKENKMTKARR